MNEPERRYTDRELAAIMKAAAGARSVATAPVPAGRTGLTLAELQEIAVQAGIAPEAVAHFARLLPVQAPSETARLVGGPVTIQLEFAVTGEADEDAGNRAIAAIRRVMGQQGRTRQAGSVLEWRNDQQPTSLAVNVNRMADGTAHVSLLVDRRGAAATLTALAAMGAGISFGLTGAILEPTGVAAIGGLALGIGGAAAVGARAFWASSTRRYRALLARLTAAVAEALEPAPTPRA